MIAAERIDDECHAFSIGEPVQFDRPVLRPIVDGFVQATRLQEGMLAAPRRSVDRGADVARDVDRGKSNAAAGIVNQHCLIVLQRAHDHEQLPRSEVVHRYGGSLFIGERGWFRKDLFLRHDHYVRITAEASQREDVGADPGMVHTSTHGVHQARDLVANDTGNFRRVRIQALAREDIGKVDAAGFYANPDLARGRARVGGLTQLQFFRATVTDDKHLFHFSSA